MRVGVEVRGEAGRERHDRERRVDRERVRDERAVAHVEPLDVPGLRVRIDDRALRVAAHAAGPLHVRRDQAGPADARGPGLEQHLAREVERAVGARALALVERRRERLHAVLVDAHAAVVLVVRHREHADPAAEAAHRLDERRAPERAVLVLERRREADRILDRRRLDHEAAVLVVLVPHRVRGDRIHHVRVLRLVEEAVDETRRMEAEVAADEAAARAVGQPGAQQQLRRVERPTGHDDGARIDPLQRSVAVGVLDARRLAALDHDALDVRAGAQLELPAAQASWM